MSKFAKIKKTLAVSVCSSMLFSGEVKTSGMNSENIPLLNSNDLKMPKNLRNLGMVSFMKERSTAVVEWVFGTIAV